MFYNISQKDFITSQELRLYNIHYSRYINNLSLSGGLFWFNSLANGVNFDVDTGIELAGYNDKRGDNLGVFYSVGYQYPLYEYLSIGIRNQGYFSVFEGFIAANISPFIAFKF